MFPGGKDGLQHFMTVKETAEYLRVSESTIWRWLQEGRLPSVKIGNSRKIRREDLDWVIREEAPSYNWRASNDPLDKPELVDALERHLDRIRKRLGGNIPADSVELLHEIREERS
ncbi:MAG: helix-turn-helix domain-containing protein [Firmicutes bacterium]|nr:helix-turn-helix domain-containing protein [Bacillota bacterium]